MRYFTHLLDPERLFFRLPEPFSKTTPREELRSGVGALLYTPGSTVVADKPIPGLTALAVCLEDAVADSALPDAVRNVERLLQKLTRTAEQTPDRPLLFLRIRNTAMLEQMADVLIQCSPALTGVILPKVTPETLETDLTLVEQIHAQTVDPFYAMPILEAPELLSGDRPAFLRAVRACTDRHFDRILNIRIGATDLCGRCGIRRRPGTPIYQVAVIAACIADIVRVFALEDRYTVSGPVWEYFPATGKPRNNHTELGGLIQETLLDQQNGLFGKTCIHPTQLLPVQAACTVSWEDWQDACAILDGETGGVLSSACGNRMNERSPHAVWARKILRQARFFGVCQPGIGIPELLRRGIVQTAQPLMGISCRS